MNQIKFMIFSDFHYWENNYPQSIEPLEEIMAAANDAKVDFVVQCGDLCHNIPTSEPLRRAYLDNPYGLRTYNCWGNHETEAADSIEAVLEALGQKNTYDYYDVADGFRLILLDSNFYPDENGVIRHNPPRSWGMRGGDIFGDEQIKWLEETLASTDRHCLIFSHASFENSLGMTDGEKTRAVISAANDKCPGKVMMCCNGHYHRDHLALTNNIVWFDVNASLNVEWQPRENTLYSEEFKATARMTKNCCFSKDPLYAIVTVSEDGHIKVEGRKSEFLYGVSPQKLGWPVPFNPFDREASAIISSGEFQLAL